MKFCRYEKEGTPDKCKGCKAGCLNKRPVAYINREFEEAVEEMERNAASKS